MIKVYQKPSSQLPTYSLAPESQYTYRDSRIGWTMFTYRVSAEMMLKHTLTFLYVLKLKMAGLIVITE